MKVIQIRGSGGAGKTTTCRQFIINNGMKCVEIPIVGEKGAKSYIMKSPDNQVVVLGRYDRKIGGCDLFNNRKQVFDVILWVIRNIKARVIIFEGLIYSSGKFAVDMCEEVKKHGYEYVGITLATPPTVALKRLYRRNGGSPINESNVYAKYKQVISVHDRLVKSGYTDYLIDTSNIPINEMHKTLERVVNER